MYKHNCFYIFKFLPLIFKEFRLLQIHSFKGINQCWLTFLYKFNFNFFLIQYHHNIESIKYFIPTKSTPYFLGNKKESKNNQIDINNLPDSAYLASSKINKFNNAIKYFKILSLHQINAIKIFFLNLCKINLFKGNIIQ